MNIRSIFQGLSALVLIVSLLMVFPLITAVFYGEWPMIMPFLWPMIASLLVFGPYLLLDRFVFREGSNRALSPRDGIFLVTVSWICAAAIGMVPFLISGYIRNPGEAFFEAMSGFTTTGATILPDIESLPRSLLFWRSQTHWLGGMGIIVLTVAVFPLLGIGGYQLMKAEAPGPDVDRISHRISETAKILWLIYIGMTVLETVLLLFGGMDLFDAVTHTFGTLATGGFSTRNASVGAFSSPYIQWVITIFMILAGANFVMHFRLLTGRFDVIRKNSELKAYAAVTAIASALIAVSLLNSGIAGGLEEGLRLAAFQVASILTTTGFITTDYELWPHFSGAILFLLMFLGGCAGSTGGGIKIVRILTMFKQGILELRYLHRPRNIYYLRINGQAVRKSTIYPIFSFFFLYAATILIATLTVTSFGYDILTAFSTSLATLGNIGPGFGAVGPVQNYQHFPEFLKWFLSFVMLAGRLELFTVFILLTPNFWRR